MTATEAPPEQILNDRVVTALDYANRGWSVFPLIPGTKRPAVPNHPAGQCDQTDPKCWPTHTGWEQRATTNPHRITKAWTHRSWGIGIATGPSNLIVVDLDKAKDGHPSGAQTLCDLESEYRRKLPDTWTVATPSGGWHLYYTQPDTWALRNTNNKVGPGIDTRGHGGYVVAPPTTTPDGNYRVIKPLDLVPLPKWFSQLLAANNNGDAEPLAQQLTLTPTPATPVCPTAVDRYVTAAITHQLQHLTNATTGNRNQTLFHTAVALGQLVGTGAVTEADVAHQIETVIGSHVTAGAYSWAQAQRTIRSGIARGVKQPRRLPANLL